MSDILLQNLNIDKATVTMIAQIIAGLATIAIVSMDLGVAYNKQEEKIYTSKIFQVLAVLSVGYLMSENATQGVALLAAWYCIKYMKMTV